MPDVFSGTPSAAQSPALDVGEDDQDCRRHKCGREPADRGKSSGARQFDTWRVLTPILASGFAGCRAPGPSGTTS
jgi:hypothetical protein